MLLKQLLVSAFLFCALLMLGISLKKPLYGIIGLVAEILLSFLSTISCFIFFFVGMFLLFTFLQFFHILVLLPYG